MEWFSVRYQPEGKGVAGDPCETFPAETDQLHSPPKTSVAMEEGGVPQNMLSYDSSTEQGVKDNILHPLLQTASAPRQQQSPEMEKPWHWRLQTFGQLSALT